MYKNLQNIQKMAELNVLSASTKGAFSFGILDLKCLIIYFVAHKGIDPVQFIRPSSADTFMFLLMAFRIFFMVFISFN